MGQWLLANMVLSSLSPVRIHLGNKVWRTGRYPPMANADEQTWRFSCNGWAHGAECVRQFELFAQHELLNLTPPQEWVSYWTMTQLQRCPRSFQWDLPPALNANDLPPNASNLWGKIILTTPNYESMFVVICLGPSKFMVLVANWWWTHMQLKMHD